MHELTILTKQEAEKAYAALIQLRRTEVLAKDKACPGRVEVHHIIPLSCGGKDIESNRIALYAKEHFMAHVYLWRIHHDDSFHALTTSALMMMCTCLAYSNDRSYISFVKSSELYQLVREEHAQWASANLPDKLRGPSNGVYGKHWFKDPDSMADGMFFDGQLPSNWVRGHYQPRTEKSMNAIKRFSHSAQGKKLAYCPATGERRYKLPGEPLPEGFISSMPRRTEAEKQKISLTLKSYTTGNPEHCRRQHSIYHPMYLVHCEAGFEAVKQQFGYPYTLQNFVQQCKLYLPEFVPSRGRRRKKHI